MPKVPSFSFITPRLDYAEPYENLRHQVKTFNELMEERKFGAAVALATSMVEMSTTLLIVATRLKVQENVNQNIAKEESAG